MGSVRVGKLFGVEEPARTTRTTVDNLLMEFQRLNSAATATQGPPPPEHSQTPRPGMITCCSPWLRIFSSKVGYRQNHLGFRAGGLVGEVCMCVVLSLGTRLAMVDAGTSDYSNAGAITAI